MRRIGGRASVTERTPCAVRSGSMPRPSQRLGFTLYEMLLVLVILLLVGGVAWPITQWWFRDHALKQSAADVRVAMDRTRVHAIDHAILYEFRFEPGGRRFIALPGEIPLDPGTGPGTGSSSPAGMGSSTGGTASTQPTVEYLFGELPEGITFAPLEPLGTNPIRLNPAMYGNLQESQKIAAAMWSAPVIYRPDGTTATDHRVGLVADDDRHTIILALRGLTGTVSTGDVHLQKGTQ